MANLLAIHSVGNSLVTYLQNTYPESPELEGPFPSCEFRLLSSGELDDMDDPGITLSLFLHRVTINEHLRNTRQINGTSRQQEVPLSVDLHYLMTVWTKSALAEHAILAWAMRQFHLNPVLDASHLTLDAGWNPGEVIQVIPAEMSHEDMMRIWDTLKPSYRLSLAYIARVVRIESDRFEDARPVLATRFSWAEQEVGQ